MSLDRRTLLQLPLVVVAGAAASALAIEGNTSVQDVPYARLRERLLSDG